MGILDEAIAKYGGADEAYKLKLKQGIRDTLGYQNYMSRLGDATAKPASIGDIKGLSPAGINARISSRFNTQNADINALEKNAGAVDAAAESISSKLASKNKEADKYRYDSSFIFEPQDELDRKILDYARNPRNEDGTVKTVEQFEKEVNAEFGQGALGGDINPNRGFMDVNAPKPAYSLDDVRNRIVERLPADFSGKESAYSYRFNGMTEEQAAEEQMIDYSNLIAAGRGKEVPAELYPMAYSLLSDSEKKKLMGVKTGSEREL